MNIGIALGVPFSNQKKNVFALSFDGVNDNLQLPSLTMDCIELDCLIESGSILLDARLGMTNGYITRASSLNGTWSQILVNNVVSATFPLNVRNKVKFKSSAVFTDDVTLFSNYVNGGFVKGILFELTCYLEETIVARYEISKGTVLDISGNGKHASINGATWIKG